MATRKIEGIATVTRRFSTTNGMAWESQAADFEINGETFTWIKETEETISGLEKGDIVTLRAFARDNGRLFRVQVTKHCSSCNLAHNPIECGACGCLICPVEHYKTVESEPACNEWLVRQIDGHYLAGVK